MNIRSALKTLPVIAALALGLALSSNYAMADNGDRGRHKSQYSHDNGKSHNKTHKSTKQYKEHAYNKHGHKIVAGSHYSKPYTRHNSHSRNKYDRHAHRSQHKNNHRNKHGHKHDYRGHTHNHYVVNGHGHHDRYFDFDNLRFMIGLHTNNFDIILRD